MSTVPCQSNGWALAFGCGYGRGVGREGVDDFAGAGVVELGAGFVFDGAGVGLEAFDLIAEASVFEVELLHLLLEEFFVLALVLVGGDAVLAEKDVIAHKDSEYSGGNAGDFAR